MPVLTSSIKAFIEQAKKSSPEDCGILCETLRSHLLSLKKDGLTNNNDAVNALPTEQKESLPFWIRNGQDLRELFQSLPEIQQRVFCQAFASFTPPWHEIPLDNHNRQLFQNHLEKTVSQTPSSPIESIQRFCSLINNQSPHEKQERYTRYRQTLFQCFDHQQWQGLSLLLDSLDHTQKYDLCQNIIPKQITNTEDMRDLLHALLPRDRGFIIQQDCIKSVPIKTIKDIYNIYVYAPDNLRQALYTRLTEKTAFFIKTWEDFSSLLFFLNNKHAQDLRKNIIPSFIYNAADFQNLLATVSLNEGITLCHTLKKLTPFWVTEQERQGIDNLLGPEHAPILNTTPPTIQEFCNIIIDLPASALLYEMLYNRLKKRLEYFKSVTDFPLILSHLDPQYIQDFCQTIIPCFIKHSGDLRKILQACSLAQRHIVYQHVTQLPPDQKVKITEEDKEEIAILLGQKMEHLPTLDLPLLKESRDRAYTVLQKALVTAMEQGRVFQEKEIEEYLHHIFKASSLSRCHCIAQAMENTLGCLNLENILEGLEAHQQQTILKAIACLHHQLFRSVSTITFSQTRTHCDPHATLPPLAKTDPSPHH
jgi:hypothetical protein